MILEELTMIEFEEGMKVTKTILIPFGSLEEHGPHLPLSTDTIQAYEIGKKASLRTPLFIAPPIHYGYCRSTSCHPGTVSISTATLKGLMKDIVRSFYCQGMRYFIILSGHAGGSHRMTLQDAGEELITELSEAKIAIVIDYEIAKSVASDLIETEQDCHAGEIETSRIMNSHPHLVKGVGKREYPDFPEDILVRDKRKFWPNGVWGDPSKASATKGELMENLIIEKIIEVARQLERFEE